MHSKRIGTYIVLTVFALCRCGEPSRGSAAAAPTTSAGWLRAGVDAEASGHYRDALSDLTQCAGAARRHSDAKTAERCIGYQGVVYVDLAQNHKAVEKLREALDLARRAGDGQYADMWAMKIGNVCYSDANYEAAIEYYNQSLGLAIEAGDSSGEQADLGSIGNAFVQSSKYESALTCFQRQLALVERIGDLQDEEADLGNIGAAYEYIGQYARALDYDRRSATLAAKLGDTRTQEHELGNMGSVYGDLGRYGQALDYCRQCLALASQLGDQTAVQESLSSIGNMYTQLAEYDMALDYDQRTLALSEKRGDIAAEEREIGNLGVVNYDLGEYDRALGCYERSLALAVKIGDVRTQEHQLGNIGNVCDELGQLDKALDCDQKSLLLATRIGDIDTEIHEFTNIGIARNDLGTRELALSDYQQALSIATRIGDARSAGQAFSNIGLVYSELSRFDKALEYYHEALFMQRRIGDLSTAGVTLGNIMAAERKLGRPNIAIYYGKQSVNDYQTIRAGVAKLDAAAQKSYLSTVESTYRQLADILVGEGRLPESEQVLAMLKDQEASDFLDRDAALTPVALTVSFDPGGEQSADNDEQKLADPVVTAGRKLDDLMALHLRTSDQVLQVVSLRKQLNAAKAAYDKYVSVDLPRELASSPDANRANPADVSPIQQQLQSMGPGAVAIITLVEPDYLRLIVVTAQTQKAEVSKVAASDLRSLVGQWRLALQNPNLDPRPLGRQLADKIMAPIQADLDGDGASTLLFSLDDVLRYVPMAALYDGHHYLVEKYRVAVFTGATLTAAAAPVDWSRTPQALLALGVTQAHRVPDPATGKDLSFPALPGVAREIADIARSSGAPDGILPGEALVDGKFTADSLQLGLATGYPVVHIASHFDLGANDKSSFLLLGDGTALTLDKLFDAGGRIFQGVDLLTLSACQTGEDVASSDGHQVESLGMVAQEQGAASILASLWPVSDESTPLFMRAFYDKWANTPGMTKAEALREAQIGMLQGDAADASTTTASTAPMGRRDISGPATAQSPNNLPPFTPDPKAPYAHPCYWAPFVLIGNWK